MHLNEKNVCLAFITVVPFPYALLLSFLDMLLKERKTIIP